MIVSAGTSAGTTGVLITDGGAHPAEKWAKASALMLMDWFAVNPYSARRFALEAEKVRLLPLIAHALESHHAEVQAVERERVVRDETRIGLPDYTLDAREHTEVEKCVEKIYRLVEPLLERAQLYVVGLENQPDIEAHVRGVIYDRVQMDLRTSMKSERSSRADILGI